jgi:hypothetical protein
MADLVEALRQLSADTGAALNPVIIATGVVVSVDPLKIQIDQKTTLLESMLRLTNAVKDHTTDMVIPGVGLVTVSVASALKVGEAVFMVRDQGGQKYTVIDRT